MDACTGNEGGLAISDQSSDAIFVLQASPSNVSNFVFSVNSGSAGRDHVKHERQGYVCARAECARTSLHTAEGVVRPIPLLATEQIYSLSVSLFLFLVLFLSLSLSFFLSLSLSLLLSLSVFLSLALSLYPSLSFSISLPLFIYLSVFLF